MQSSQLHRKLGETLGEFFQAEAEELRALWDKLSDKEKARLFVDLAAFVVPKKKDVSITAMNEPTADAIARVFDFSDPEDEKLWINQKRKEIFQ